MDFLDFIESVQAENAKPSTLFGGEGQRVIAGKSPKYQKGFQEAASLIADLVSGGSYLTKHKFQEAMSTSDFPVYMGDIMDRRVLASYAEAPSTYQLWSFQSEVSDFRPAKRYYFDDDGTLDQVDELGEYREAKLAGGDIELAVKKFGKRFDFSWEALLQDDFSVLTSQPDRFGVAARRTEEREATRLLFAPNFFSTANNNYQTGVPLTMEGVQSALIFWNERNTPNGESVQNPPKYLMVPPALEMQARAILNATEITTWDNGDERTQLRTANWITSQLTLVVNYSLPLVAPERANEDWYLIADPTVGRPAFEVAKLRGYTAPSLFMKSPNALAIGGGQSGALMGDFDHDAIGYKVRHVIGGAPIDPLSAYKFRTGA